MESTGEMFRQLLSKCHSSIRDYANLDTLIPYLNEEGLLSQEDLSFLNNKLYQQSHRIDYLIFSLPRKGSDAESRFMKCLENAKDHLGHEELLKILHKTISERPAIGDLGSLETTIEEFHSSFEKVKKTISDLSHENAALKKENFQLQSELENEKIKNLCFKDLLDIKSNDQSFELMWKSVMKIVEMLQTDKKERPKSIHDVMNYATRKWKDLDGRMADLERQNSVLKQIVSHETRKVSVGDTKFHRQGVSLISHGVYRGKVGSSSEHDTHHRLSVLDIDINKVLKDQKTNVVKTGLLKKEGGQKKNWKQRYVVLSHQYICYYEPNPQDDLQTKPQPLGIIPLKGLEITECSDPKIKCCFEIKGREGDIINSQKLKRSAYVQGNHDVYRMQAADDKIKDEWMNKIKHMIASSESVLA